ncbi:MAG: sulfite exporter TauE/SafE family protein [bacterium]
MIASSFILLFLGGIATGTLGSLLGIGGGIFLVPFLTLVIGVPAKQAIATSIIAVIATSSAGASVNLKRNTVNVRLGFLLESVTVLGAIGGSFTASLLSGETLIKLFATLLLVVAILMIHKTRQKKSMDAPSSQGILHGQFTDEANGTVVSYAVHRIPAVMGVSFLAGNVSGLLGIGGGIFKVPAMHILGGVPMKIATATSNFTIGVTAAASAFIYFSHGHVNPWIASSSALGVLGGSLLGTVINRKIESTVLTWIFVVVLLFVSIQMYLK